MAIDITIEGNQIKVAGAPVFDGEPVYDNMSNIKPEVNGDDVRLINYVTEQAFLPDTDFNDFDTPDGTALGSAILVADAIAALLVQPTGAPSGTSDVNLIEIAGTAVNTSSGNADAGTQVIAVATDDVNLAAINTATAASGTEVTLAALLAKVIAAPSTEAKQDAANALLTTIDTALSDVATQTTLAAILAKIIAAPATEAKQDTGNTSLGNIDTNTTGLTGTIGDAVGAKGVPLVAKFEESTIHTTVDDGDNEGLTISAFKGLNTTPEQHHVIDSMNVTTGWAVTGNDTTNLATTTSHILGTAALTFDKVDGAANTVRAGIEKTLTALNLGGISPHDLIQTSVYLSSVADADYIFACLGTDSSNYNEWRIEASALTGGDWATLIFDIGDASFAGSTGNGWDSTVVTYISIGVGFNSETDTLSGIIFDEVSFHTNQHTNASINSEVTSSVNSANVNLQKINGSPTDKGSGNVSNGTQRVVLPNDVALPAGTNAIGKLAANSGVDIGDVDVTSISAGSTLIGDVGISGARTSGGSTPHKNLDVDQTEDQVKGTAGQVYWIHAINLSIAPLFLKFYNATAASVTVGTTVPDLTFPVPTAAATVNGTGFVMVIPNGIEFTTAITIAGTTGVADNDSGAPGVNELIVNLGYA